MKPNLTTLSIEKGWVRDRNSYPKGQTGPRAHPKDARSVDCFFWGVAVTYPNRPWMDIFSDLLYKFVPASVLRVYGTHIHTHTLTQASTTKALYTKDTTTGPPKIHKITFLRIMTIVFIILSSELPEIAGSAIVSLSSAPKLVSQARHILKP